MKKTNNLKRRKIITYYAVTIVIPCIILGVLAFRGIKNDQALLERESRKLVQTTSQGLISDIINYLRDVEDKFLRLTDSTFTPQNYLFEDYSLAVFLKKKQIISGVFFLDIGNKLSLLDSHILYNPAIHNETKNPTISPSLIKVIEQGWEYEYRIKDYNRAIKHYHKSLLTTNNKKGRAIILISISRLQKKIYKKEEALKTYKTLLEFYSDIYIEGELPIGIISQLESSQLYLELGDTIQHVKTINTLLTDLKNTKWRINHATFTNSLEPLIESIDILKNATEKPMDLLNTSDSLLQEIKKRELKSNYLLDFKSVKGSNDLFKSSGNRQYLTSNIGNTYFIFLNQNSNKQTWGLIYNQDFLLKNMIKPRLMSLSSGLKFKWEIINNNGDVLEGIGNLKDKMNMINISFPNPLPSWTLIILPEENLGVATFIFRNQGIFFYIFLLILIILTFGLYFTMFIVNNELRISQLKSNFISTVSHEFKSPLTAIQQMTEMLDDGRVPSDVRKQKYYRAILKESNRLSLLINNMLDFSKMEVGQKSFHFEKGNLADIAEEMVLSIRNYWSDKGFEINFILNKVIPDSYFDKESIKQVLQNLIDNACKYSGTSKKVDVEVSTDTRNIVLSVKDYGIGIQKKDQKELFNRFFRSSDTLTQQIKGSGIGLTIVKQIVDKHLGELLLNSEYGKGSQFQVLLPIKKI
jgi:signal transduction histidine kinase/tetratricopeptide (TPR) repeat protein